MSKKNPTRANTQIVKSQGSAIDPNNLTQEHFEVEVLPGRTHKNPLILQKKEFVDNGIIHDHEQRLMYEPRPQEEKAGQFPVSQSAFTLKLACPRISLHFNPKTTVIGIVTCGGLCPGLNDVIRSLTLTAIGSYHVKKVLGFRYGYWGLSAAGRDTAIELTPDTVRTIHRQGGTMLGSSRGGQKISEMVDTLQHYGVNILFTAGGDGTQKGSLAIQEECRRRGLDVAVVGIPKTIDNDLSFSHRTFGYKTAVEEAVRAIRAAHAEASSHEYGIGVVKLMGRESGFIAAQATVSSAQVSICLIPEVPINKQMFETLLRRRFEISRHAVIVVAEGFGQNWEECNSDLGRDASGNKKLADIGVVIKQTCEKFLKSDPKYKLSTVKYIDPSYMIRACPPSASDASFCTNLSTLAVHEAMAGNTGCVITQWYNNFVLVPIKLAVSLRNIVSINGALWRQVREITVDTDVDLKKVEKQELTRELEALTERRERLITRMSKL